MHPVEVDVLGLQIAQTFVQIAAEFRLGEARYFHGCQPWVAPFSAENDLVSALSSGDPSAHRPLTESFAARKPLPVDQRCINEGATRLEEGIHECKRGVLRQTDPKGQRP